MEVADPISRDIPLVFISRGFETLTGYSREFACGRNCRFLQPNSKRRNDLFNLEDRQRMRVFCDVAREAIKFGENSEPYQKVLRGETPKIINLLINENEQGFPFLNLLVMQYVIVCGNRPYIFGLQTNWAIEPEIMAELFAGDETALFFVKTTKKRFQTFKTCNFVFQKHFFLF